MRLNAAMTRLADGDRKAMEEVMRLVHPPVRALAGKWLSHEADAEDVAQEVVVDLFRRAHEFEVGRDALTWALTLGVWHCRTERKRRSRRRHHGGDGLEDLHAEDEGAEDALIARETRTHLAEVLTTLSESEQSTLDEVLSGASLSAAMRKRKERMITKLKRLLLGEVLP